VGEKNQPFPAMQADDQVEEKVIKLVLAKKKKNNNQPSSYAMNVHHKMSMFDWK